MTPGQMPEPQAPDGGPQGGNGAASGPGRRAGRCPSQASAAGPAALPRLATSSPQAAVTLSHAGRRAHARLQPAPGRVLPAARPAPRSARRPADPLPGSGEPPVWRNGHPCIAGRIDPRSPSGRCRPIRSCGDHGWNRCSRPAPRPPGSRGPAPPDPGAASDPGPELTQDRVVETGVGQIQAQRVLPVDPGAHRLGGLLEPGYPVRGPGFHTFTLAWHRSAIQFPGGREFPDAIPQRPNPVAAMFRSEDERRATGRAWRGRGRSHASSRAERDTRMGRGFIGKRAVGLPQPPPWPWWPGYSRLRPAPARAVPSWAA